MKDKFTLIKDYKTIVFDKFREREVGMVEESKMVQSEMDLIKFCNNCLTEFSKLFPYATGLPAIDGLSKEEIQDLIDFTTKCSSEAHKKYSELFRNLSSKYKIKRIN